MKEETITREYGDASRLMESIRAETARRISVLDIQTKNELQKIEHDCDEEIRALMKAQKRETDAAIAKAVAIMKNRAAIEKRKLRLNAVEEFMRIMVDRAVSDFIANNRDGYVLFLENQITETLAGTGGHDLLIHLCPGDAGLEKGLLDCVIRKTGYPGKVGFAVDETMTVGGVVIEDMKDGISYNHTVGRIITRAYDTLRKDVAAIVQEYIKAAG